MARTAETRIDRTIPPWAALLVGTLAQDRPPVLTRDDLAGYLADTGVDRPIDSALRLLVNRGWLVGTRVKGVWAFMPPGETETNDPYLDLRAWLAREPDADFAIAGEAVALHLGYVDRIYEGPTALWLPHGRRPPFGIRPIVSVIHIDFPDGVDLAPTFTFLRRRQLDVTRWAGGIPAFGPEALFVQLAVRPTSFVPWGDLAPHFSVLTHDCDAQRVAALLEGQSSSAWQRAAYMMEVGGNTSGAATVSERRPPGKHSHVTWGNGDRGVHNARYGIVDRFLTFLVDEAYKA